MAVIRRLGVIVSIKRMRGALKLNEETLAIQIFIQEKIWTVVCSFA